ncbi:TraB/GumN family protein [Jiella sp. KSK16Y-1]|uniref:TraB/GumN family protein n=2 Tax=Jiella mangrovi TaxID=2821407 RepID=A0ABS4BK44_9HYPH|nr:TraB/GumN family protein [Jiella mangrovi]
MPALSQSGAMASVEAKAAKVSNGEGRFFRIEKAGLAPSYLLGTMHLGDPRLLALPEPIDRAFEDSQRLVIETTDVLDPMKMAGAMFADPALTTLPKGQTLGDFLKPADRQKLARMLDAKGVPLQAVERLQPWFLSSGFMLPACMAKTSGGMPIVLDTSLAARAKAAGIPVEGLETASEQLRSMAAIPMKEQIDGFVALLSAEDRLDDIFETMIDLYLREHVSTIMPAIEAAVPDGGMMVGAGEGYAAFEEKVITERNLRMADRLEPFLSKGGSFVAVGALHLPGEKGLVALLRARGYRLVRVPAPVGAAPARPHLDDAEAAQSGAPSRPEPAGAPRESDADDTKK